MRTILVSLAVFDVLVGGLLLLWPGFWQEVLHPYAMGTNFYPLQRLGVVWLGRAAATFVAARRADPLWLAAVAGLWAVEVPADLLVGWRTAGTGPATVWIYAGRAVLAASAGGFLWRAAQSKERAG